MRPVVGFYFLEYTVLSISSPLNKPDEVRKVGNAFNAGDIMFDQDGGRSCTAKVRFPRTSLSAPAAYYPNLDPSPYPSLYLFPALAPYPDPSLCPRLAPYPSRL